MSSFAHNLDLRQSQNQTLVMTPELQQAIKLLQLNNFELNEFIDEELEKNPLLEKPERETAAENPPEAKPDKDDVDSAFESHDTNDRGGNTDFDGGSMAASTGAGGNTSFDTHENAFENRMAAEKSLRDHLLEQLRVAFTEDRDQMIGTHLIDCLDESGYLREDVPTLCARLGCSQERVDGLLSKMRDFDPTGVFAKDLPDCLAMQLDERGALDAPMQALLDNIALLGSYDLDKLADICGVNDVYLRDMMAELRTLNPKPAALFDHFVAQTAIPDVLMKRLPKNLGGGWRVELNQATLPRVLVNQEYYTQVSQGATRKEDRDYISGHLSSANWLVRALNQRAETILKVAAEIVERQDAFFNYGIEFLTPLTLKDIAEVVDLHESTVSRVTMNKYIGTPRGLFELKFFFTSGLVSESGVIHSSESVKARIKILIDAEDPAKILSDDKIVDILKKDGIDIARRTVAKYREAMHIGSSVQRRKEKRRHVF